MSLMRTGMGWGVVVVLFLAAGAGAQTPDARDTRTPSQSPLGLWDADMMMESATVGIARRYNLESGQEQYTRELLRTRTLEFLDKHEAEMRGLLKDLLMQQMTGKPPTSDQVKGWGQRAMPLLTEARKAIMEGTMEWREILSDEQKHIHDLDLKLMEANFNLLGDRFARWENGEFRPGDWIGMARPQPTHNETPRQNGETSDTSWTGESNEDYWDVYVKKFIRDYKLDEAQRTSALAILKDCRDKADQYRATRKEELEKARNQLRAAMEKKNVAAIRAASGQIQELEKHISTIFEELKSRLEQLPTEAQRKAYAAAAQPIPASGPTVAPTAAPAASQPAGEPAAASQPAGEGGGESKAEAP